MTEESLLVRSAKRIGRGFVQLDDAITLVFWSCVGLAGLAVPLFQARTLWIGGHPFLAVGLVVVAAAPVLWLIRWYRRQTDSKLGILVLGLLALGGVYLLVGMIVGALR